MCGREAGGGGSEACAKDGVAVVPQVRCCPPAAGHWGGRLFRAGGLGRGRGDAGRVKKGGHNPPPPCAPHTLIVITTSPHHRHHQRHRPTSRPTPRRRSSRTPTRSSDWTPTGERGGRERAGGAQWELCDLSTRVLFAVRVVACVVACVVVCADCACGPPSSYVTPKHHHPKNKHLNPKPSRCHRPDPKRNQPLPLGHARAPRRRPREPRRVGAGLRRRQGLRARRQLHVHGDEVRRGAGGGCFPDYIYMR